MHIIKFLNVCNAYIVLILVCSNIYLSKITFSIYYFVNENILKTQFYIILEKT